MSVRALIDEVRLGFVSDTSISPAREITYTPDATGTPQTLNAFVGAGQFTEEEKLVIANYQSFGGLALAAKPEVGDTVSFDGVDFKVVRHTKLGALYTVFGETKRHNGRPSQR